MPLHAVDDVGHGRLVDGLIAKAASSGTAGHPYITSPELLESGETLRNLADAAHHLCMLHGRLPGIVDLAVARAPVEASAWLISTAATFTSERALITQILVAAPPLPSTPGQAECETAILAQRHALDMLARSERMGCAVGAAVALLLDWPAVRSVLDVAAERFGIEFAPNLLPDIWAITEFVSGLPSSMERAIAFGAEQLFVQQRGLWDLLEAREQARR